MSAPSPDADGNSVPVPAPASSIDDTAISTRPRFRAHLPAHLSTATFLDRDLALEKLDEFAKDNGFLVSIRSSANRSTYLCCRRARYPPKTGANSYDLAAATRKRKSESNYLSFVNCPYSVKIGPSADRPECMVLSELNTLHNHAPFPEGFETGALRRLRPEKKARIGSEASSTPAPADSAAPTIVPSADMPPPPQRQYSKPISRIETSTPPGKHAEMTGLGQDRHGNDASDDEDDLTTRDASSTASVVPNPASVNTTSRVRALVSRQEGHSANDAYQDDDDDDMRSAARSAISTCTDASAIRGLLSLSVDALGHTSQSRGAHYGTRRDVGGTLPRSNSARHDAGTEVPKEPLQTLLRAPPYDSTMQEVAKLSRTQADRALQWAKSLVGVLEMHLHLIKESPGRTGNDGKNTGSGKGDVGAKSREANDKV